MSFVQVQAADPSLRRVPEAPTVSRPARTAKTSGALKGGKPWLAAPLNLATTPAKRVASEVGWPARKCVAFLS